MVTVVELEVDAVEAVVVVGTAVADTVVVAVVAVFWPPQATTRANASDHTALRIRGV